MCQKFMSMFVLKILLVGKIPTLMDQQFLLLLALHFLTFCYFHSESGRDMMKKIEKSQTRKFLQEMFKGYGKALNLLDSTRKAIKLETEFHYFIGVLVVRGSVSAIFKQGLLSIIIRKPMSLHKPKTNFFINSLPTIMIYTCKYVIRYFLIHFYDQEWLAELEGNLQFYYVIFMVVSRLIRIVGKQVRKIEKKRRQQKEKLSQSFSEAFKEL